jgi:hypothetical protein
MPASLFTAPIGDITADDVNAFLDENIEEGVRLDYKEADHHQHGIPKSITSEVVAFSNTYGGLIIVGVGVDKTTNRPTTREGVLLLAKGSLEEQVTSLCYNSIVPPVAPEIGICEFKAPDGSDRAYVVLRVQPSPTVHATRENAVLVRAGSENPHADLRTLRLLFEREQQREHLFAEKRHRLSEAHWSLSARQWQKNWQNVAHRIYLELLPIDAIDDLLPYGYDLPTIGSLDDHIIRKMLALGWMPSEREKMVRLPRGLGIIDIMRLPSVIDAIHLGIFYADRSGGIFIDLPADSFRYLQLGQANYPERTELVQRICGAVADHIKLAVDLLRERDYHGRIQARLWLTGDKSQPADALWEQSAQGETVFFMQDKWWPELAEKIGILVSGMTRTAIGYTFRFKAWGEGRKDKPQFEE